MNCQEIHPLLHAYIDGELDLPHALEVERHVGACPACAAAIGSWQALHSALRDHEVAYRAPGQLRSRLFAGTTKPPLETRQAKNRQPFWQWLALGATAIAALALLLQPFAPATRDRLIDEAVAGHIRSLMAEHLTDVASSDRHTVKPWFNGRLDFSPDVRDFAAQGFPLVGGRLDYLDGRAVAALVYRRDKHPINVFVWPLAAETTPPPPASQARRGYTVVMREQGGLRYCLVSDVNPKELEEFADLLGK